MILYSDCIPFIIAGQEVNLISDITDYGMITIAEIDGTYLNMWLEPANLSTAIFAFQELNNRELTDQELKQTLDQNPINKETTQWTRRQ